MVILVKASSQKWAANRISNMTGLHWQQFLSILTFPFLRDGVFSFWQDEIPRCLDKLDSQNCMDTTDTPGHPAGRTILPPGVDNRRLDIWVAVLGGRLWWWIRQLPKRVFYNISLDLRQFVFDIIYIQYDGSVGVSWVGYCNVFCRKQTSD